MDAAKLWTFFIVIAPGLENLAAQELQLKAPLIGLSPDFKVIQNKGSLSLITTWDIGRKLVYVLRIPTRILLRLEKFKAKDFARFFNQLKGQPWHQWLAHPTPNFKIVAHECRLIQTTRLEETAHEALKAAHQAFPFSQRYLKENIPAENVLIRGEKDVWEISLDLCGESLYKRGFSKIKGAAPLRENLAAAIIQKLFQEPFEKAPTLWDPFCGSGTLLLEAATSHLSPPRKFSCEFSKFNRGHLPWKFKSSPLPVSKLIGSDIDGGLLKKLKLPEKIELINGDFFELPAPKNESLWMLMNPPYGERLDQLPANEFNQRLVKRINQIKPNRLAILLPDNWPKLHFTHLKLSEKLKFSNGGLKVSASFFH